MEGRDHSFERRSARAAVRACVLIALVAAFLAGASAHAHASAGRDGADDPALPELDSYLAQLPGSWQERAGSVIRQCHTQGAHRIPVLVLSYFPVVGTPETGLYLDESVAGTNWPLDQMRAYTEKLTQHLRWALELGSSYHGVWRDNARCSLRYDIVAAGEHLEALPVSHWQISWNPPIFRPDYMSILERHNICDLVDRLGVRQVWLWGYHHGNIAPAESNMAGPYGDISNSERWPDMPVCDRTYVLYNYNYTRALAEALEDHGHQIEAVFHNQETGALFADWGSPFGQPAPAVNSCGTVHSPPNTVGGYDWRNPAVALTDCLDWNPQHTGAVTSVSCLAWTCNDDGGATYKVWWMMNIPGYQNGLTWQGRPLRNWWEVIADFDAVVASGTGLLASDTTPPETTIDSGPSESTVDSTPTFEFSSSEPGSTFECRVDDDSLAACTSPHTTEALDDGAHTFAVLATDAAGNADPAPASRTFTLDTVPPETTLDSGPSGGTTDSTPTFEFSSSEPGSSFTCRAEAAEFAPCTSPFTTGVLADGAHSFEVQATDAAGNADPTPAARSFTLVPAAAPPEDKTVTLRLSATKRQKVLKQRGVVVKVACGSEACRVTANGKVSITGRKKALQLKSTSKRLLAGRSARLRLALSKKTRAAIAKALRRGTLKAKITVTAKDAAGNAARRTMTVKLVR